MSNRKKIGVILSGCGVYDGAEIHESVATLYALDEHNLEAVCFAPDIEQMHVVNHLNGEVVAGETRNVLVEAARIARGKISALSENSGDDLDGIIMVGGFGAAKNLSDYAIAGTKMQVLPVLESVLRKCHAAGKPIAALCISPVILAKIFADNSPKLTLGAEGDDAKKLNQIGGLHQITTHEGVVVDPSLNFVTGPCYMLDATVGQIIRGANAVVGKFKDLL